MQHMALAVKSSSSTHVHIAGVKRGDAQGKYQLLKAPLFVSMHVGGAEAAVEPPPHLQHMVLAVKSSSSFI